MKLGDIRIEVHDNAFIVSVYEPSKRGSSLMIQKDKGVVLSIHSVIGTVRKHGERLTNQRG